MFKLVLGSCMAAVLLVGCGGGGGSGPDGLDGSPAAVLATTAPLAARVMPAMSPLPAMLPMSAAAAGKGRASTPAILAGDTMVVNTTTAGDQTLRAVGATDDGGHVVAWLTVGPALVVQAYDSAGATVGGETMLAVDVGARSPAAEALALEQASVAVLGDGTFVVLWRVSRDVDLGGGISESRTVLSVERFGKDGAPLAAPALVDSLPDLGPKSPYLGTAAVLSLSDGGFVVAWTVNHYSTLFASISTLSLRWFGSDAQPAGAPVQVGEFPELQFGLLADSRGGFVLSIVRTDNSYSRDTSVEAFDAAHAFVEVVAPTLGQRLLMPLDGGYVLFMGDSAGATAQLLDGQGVARGAPVPVLAMPAAAHELVDGTFVTLTPSGNGAYLCWFADDLTALPAQLDIGSRGVLPQLASLASPAVAAAWTGSSATQGTDIFSQRFTEALGNVKKACLDAAREQHLAGRARQAFMDRCQA